MKVKLFKKKTLRTNENLLRKTKREYFSKLYITKINDSSTFCKTPDETTITNTMNIL